MKGAAVQKKSNPLPTELEKGKRNKAPRRRLTYGAKMDRVLEWLLSEEERIKDKGTDAEQITLLKKGVPWGLRFLLKDERNDDLQKEKLTVSASALSTTLASLTTRGDVKAHKQNGRTLHVMLTEKGRNRALWRRNNPEHWSVRREREAAKYSRYKISSWRRKSGVG
jgi:hypothetical protein